MNTNIFFPNKLAASTSSSELNSTKLSTPAYLFSDIIKVCEAETTGSSSEQTSTYAELSSEVMKQVSDNTIQCTGEELQELSKFINSFISFSQQPIKAIEATNNIQPVTISKKQFILSEEGLNNFITDLFQNYKPESKLNINESGSVQAIENGKNELPLKTDISVGETILTALKNDHSLNLSFKNGIEKLNIKISELPQDDIELNLNWDKLEADVKVLNDNLSKIKFENEPIIKSEKNNLLKDVTYEEKSELDKNFELWNPLLVAKPETGLPAAEHLMQDDLNDKAYKTEVIEITLKPAEINSDSNLISTVPKTNDTGLNLFQFNPDVLNTSDTSNNLIVSKNELPQPEVELFKPGFRVNENTTLELIQLQETKEVSQIKNFIDPKNEITSDKLFELAKPIEITPSYSESKIIQDSINKLNSSAIGESENIVNELSRKKASSILEIINFKNEVNPETQNEKSILISTNLKINNVSTSNLDVEQNVNAEEIVKTVSNNSSKQSDNTDTEIKVLLKNLNGIVQSSSEEKNTVIKEKIIAETYFEVKPAMEKTTSKLNIENITDTKPEEIKITSDSKIDSKEPVQLSTTDKSIRINIESTISKPPIETDAKYQQPSSLFGKDIELTHEERINSSNNIEKVKLPENELNISAKKIVPNKIGDTDYTQKVSEKAKDNDSKLNIGAKENPSNKIEVNNNYQKLPNDVDLPNGNTSEKTASVTEPVNPKIVAKEIKTDIELNAAQVKEEKKIDVQDNNQKNSSYSNDKNKDEHTIVKETQSKSSDEKDLSRNKSNESFKNILQNSEQTQNVDFDKIKIAVQSKTENELAKVIKPAELLPEFSKFIQQGDKQSITFQLTPENLGKVKLTIEILDNQVSTRIQVENEQIKQIIQTNIEQLKQSLNSSGIQLNNVNISMADSEQRAFKGFNGKRKSSDKEAKLKDDERETKVSPRSLGYNTIEFLA